MLASCYDIYEVFKKFCITFVIQMKSSSVQIYEGYIAVFNKCPTISLAMFLKMLVNRVDLVVHIPPGYKL